MLIFFKAGMTDITATYVNQHFKFSQTRTIVRNPRKVESTFRDLKKKQKTKKKMFA